MGHSIPRKHMGVKSYLGILFIFLPLISIHEKSHLPNFQHFAAILLICISMPFLITLSAPITIDISVSSFPTCLSLIV